MTVRLSMGMAIFSVSAALAFAQTKSNTPQQLSGRLPQIGKGSFTPPGRPRLKGLPSEIKTSKDTGAKDAYKPSGAEDPYVYPYGDEATYADTPLGGVATLQGNARLLYKETKFVAALIRYNRKTQIGNSPGLVTVDDAQNTITASTGLADYGKKIVNLIGQVHIIARPKPSDINSAEDSVRNEFTHPVDIRGSKVDYSWKTKVAILSRDTVITFTARERQWTVTADNMEYRGKEESALLKGNVRAKSDKGEELIGKEALITITEGAEAIDIVGVSEGSKFKVDDEDETGKPVTNPPEKPGDSKSPAKPSPDRPVKGSPGGEPAKPVTLPVKPPASPPSKNPPPDITPPQ